MRPRYLRFAIQKKCNFILRSLKQFRLFMLEYSIRWYFDIIQSKFVEICGSIYYTATFSRSSSEAKLNWVLIYIIPWAAMHSMCSIYHGEVATSLLRPRFWYFLLGILQFFAGKNLQLGK